MFFKRNKYLYAWFGLFILLAVLNACTYTQHASKKMLKHASGKTYDVIVVPGIPLEDGKWSRLMQGRIYWSKYLLDKGIAKNVMYSGSAVYTPYYEAEVMAMYARAIGIDSQHIYTETKAEHSTENIYYSYNKARQLGFKTIALASDPFQSKMLASYINKRVNSSVDIIPFVYDTLKAIEPNMLDPIIDYKQAEAENFVALPDRENFWKRFKGTRGGNVDVTAYK